MLESGLMELIFNPITFLKFLFYNLEFKRDLGHNSMGKQRVFSTKSISIKEKNGRWNFKIKICYPVKDTIKKMKWQATDWNKLVTIHILGKGLEKTVKVISYQRNANLNHSMTPSYPY